MIAKIFVLCALVAVAYGGLIPAHGLAGGSSITSRRQDDFGNYAFNYDIVDPLGATNGRWEAGDGYGNTRGAYSLNDIDGRARRVEYVADGAGFRAVVKTNEPGTAPSAPAGVVVASSQPGVVAHGPAVVRTAVAAPAIAAPVAVAPAYGYGVPAYGAAAAFKYWTDDVKTQLFARISIECSTSMIAKIAVFCALVAVAHGGLLHGLAGGTSVASRRQDDFGNYAFNYDIVDPLGATNGRWEAGDGYGNTRGAYSLTDIDGRARRVEYVADGAGFRAVVKTNEPGTAPSAPAAAVVASSQPGVVAHGPAVVKTVVAAPAIAAPVAAAPAFAAGVYGAPAYGAGVYGASVYGAGLYGAPAYGAGFLKYH
ncbi:uncharacterized protein LOC106466630 [Limulus polyphemus]|uniref:Uncharacterized protein LOC106466630 n=1 Tax=Limulus polyphemus TaxID=6850 RepID=A0ABM1T3C6_LIMPO|nr:uncharacterized protein LOC106466630 [Limulus polyphemus]